MLIVSSYQVPKEVGKVGTESSTFIEPVAERRDGIQALFAKQMRTKSPSSSQGSPSKAAKRKRSASLQKVSSDSPPKKASRAEKEVPQEIIDLCDDDGIENDNPKIEKMNTWESDSEIEYIDTPEPTPSNTKVSCRLSKVQQQDECFGSREYLRSRLRKCAASVLAYYHHADRPHAVIIT